MPTINNNNKKDNQGFKNLPAKDTELESFNDSASSLTHKFIDFLKDNGLTLPEPKIKIKRSTDYITDLITDYSNAYGEKVYKIELTSEIQDPIQIVSSIDELSIGGPKMLMEATIKTILGEYLKGYLMSKNSENTYPDNSILHELTKSMAGGQSNIFEHIFSLKMNQPNEDIDLLKDIYRHADKLDINTKFNRILEGTEGLTDLSNIDSLVYRGIDTEDLSNSLLGFMIIMYNEDKDKVAKEVLKSPYEIIKDIQSYYKDYLRS